MLLNGYQPEIFKPQCNSFFQSLHCIAYLDEDVGEALPYLNAMIGGDTYIKDPPSVTFNMHGKLVTVHHDRIAVNAFRDEAEAHNILEWLKKEINEAGRTGPPLYRNTKGPRRPIRSRSTNCCRAPTAGPVNWHGLLEIISKGLYFLISLTGI